MKNILLKSKQQGITSQNQTIQTLSRLERSQFSLSQYHKNILIGLILGDLNIQKMTLNSNPFCSFEQGFVHKEYLEHLYELFKSYCLRAPKISNRLPDKRTGKVYSRIRFHTYSLPCFVEFYNLFYPEGKKILPANIADLLTPLSLAYWIAYDGSWNKSQGYVVLSTNSFLLAEVELLISVLNDKFDLKCYKAKQNCGYIIIIPSYSVSNLQNLLA
jgi:hypothetical protein